MPTALLADCQETLLHVPSFSETATLFPTYANTIPMYLDHHVVASDRYYSSGGYLQDTWLGRALARERGGQGCFWAESRSLAQPCYRP